MSDTVNASNDIKRAKDALTFFHNKALSYSDNYNFQAGELFSFLNDRQNGQFLEGFGFAINAGDVSETKVKNAMENLADQGQGRLPMTNAAFFRALSDEAVKTSFIDAAKSVASDSASDIGVGLKRVGDTVIETAKNAGGIVTMLPFLALLVGGYFVYLKVKRFA